MGCILGLIQNTLVELDPRQLTVKVEILVMQVDLLPQGAESFAGKGLSGSVG